MKHAEHRAIVHNVADSLASGIGLMIGIYDMDVFGEASRSENGSITVDFLAGRVIEGSASSTLVKAVALYQEALAKLYPQAGGSVSDLREATVRYWSDSIGPRYTVTIREAGGRRSTTDYLGVPGKRPKIKDALGRLRPKPSMA